MGGRIHVDVGAQFVASDTGAQDVAETLDGQPDDPPAGDLEHLRMRLRFHQYRGRDGWIDPLPRLVEHGDEVRAVHFAAGLAHLFWNADDDELVLDGEVPLTAAAPAPPCSPVTAASSR